MKTVKTSSFVFSKKSPPHHLPPSPDISDGPGAGPENHARCEAGHIEDRDLRLLEAVEGVEFINIRPLQPVTEQGEEVHEEKTLLKAGKKELSLFPDGMRYLLKLMLETETFFSSPLLATCLAA